MAVTAARRPGHPVPALAPLLGHLPRLCVLPRAVRGPCAETVPPPPDRLGRHPTRAHLGNPLHDAIGRASLYGLEMAPITPCLWFDGDADAAVDQYIAIFPNSRRLMGSTVDPDTPGAEGSTLVVSFELDGRPFMALNGGPAFHFTPAVSFVVNCETQVQVDFYWDRLVDGGEPSQCGWLTDRFGVSWQIVPDRLGELMSDPDPERSHRVMQAMLKMVKLDIAQLEAAAAGD